MNTIDAADIGQLLRGRMGLLIGPGMTTFPGSFGELRDQLAARGGVTAGDTYLATCDALIDNGTADSQIRDWIRETVSGQKRSALLSHLVKYRWAAVLSAALDGYFDDAFQQESARHVSRQQVTILSDLLTPPPPRTVPVYKLLGLVTRENFAASTVGYVERRSTWRHAVKGFADLVRGNPVLCLGMSDCPGLLLDLAGEMIGDRTTTPAVLLFLADDPMAGNARLRQLLDRRVRVATVRGTVGDVARAAASAGKVGYTPSLPLMDGKPQGFARLRPFDDILAVVNEQLEPAVSANEQNQLHDLLFSPSVSRWDPYAYDMDFPRTARAGILGGFRPAVTGGRRSGAAKREFDRGLKRAKVVLGPPLAILPDTGWSPGRPAFQQNPVL
jgi:hypothetical protein